jgi:hypothetical protein
MTPYARRAILTSLRAPFLVSIFIGLNMMSSLVNAQSQSTDMEAAAVPLQHYIRAQETGNADFIRRAFSADARIVGYMGGKLLSLSTEEFAARFSGKPAEDESQRKRSFELLSVTGDAAVAKVVLNYPAVKFTDCMSLIKLDGEWKIVSKAFHAEPKNPPAEK